MQTYIPVNSRSTITELQPMERYIPIETSREAIESNENSLERFPQQSKLKAKDPKTKDRPNANKYYYYYYCYSSIKIALATLSLIAISRQNNFYKSITLNFYVIIIIIIITFVLCQILHCKNVMHSLISFTHSHVCAFGSI